MLRAGFFLISLFIFLVPAQAQVSKPCGEATNFVLDEKMPAVYLEFEQFGKANDWTQARLGDVAEKPKIEKGSDVWLRLYNNSCWDITIPTFSMYISRVPDNAHPGKDKILFGAISNGLAANVFYNVEEQDRKGVLWGGDSYSISRVVPGTSILFPVLKDHLAKDRSVYVNFNFGWENDKFSYNLAPLHRAFFWGYRLEGERKK